MKKLFGALVSLSLLAPAACRDESTDHMERARNALFERSPDEALVEYRKALDALKRDTSEAAQVQRARALKGAADVYRLELRKVKEAVSVYKELIAACPESPEAEEARIVLADLLRIHYRDLRGAIDQLTAALARNPPDGAELTYKIAKLYFELGNYEQSALEAHKVSERFPTSDKVDDALFIEGQALGMVESRRQEGIRVLTDLIARFPDAELTPHAAFELGRLREEGGDREKAIEVWVKALERHPHPEQVQAAIALARRRLAGEQPVVLGRAAAFEKPRVEPAAAAAPAPVRRKPARRKAAAPAAAEEAPVEEVVVESPVVPVRPVRSSAEAVGASAEEAASETGSD